jgi:polysaccharide export outer membrane protein
LSKPGPDGQTTTLIKRISVKALLDAADPEMNIKLTGGEEIRVPDAGKIFVVGNIKKPGAFVVREDSGATVMKALAVAEGLCPTPLNRPTFTGARRQDQTRNPVELGKIMDRKSPDIPLMADDVLYVPDASRKRS